MKCMDEMDENKKMVEVYMPVYIATWEFSSMWLMVKVSASCIITPGDFCRLDLIWMVSDVI